MKSGYPDVTIQHGSCEGVLPVSDGDGLHESWDCEASKSVLTSNSLEDLLEYCSSLPAVMDSHKFHVIDGVFSQLKPSGWIEELCFGGSWDEDSHFLLDGVTHGFHVVDPDAEIIPYVCENYKSATSLENRHQLQELLLDEMSCDKITITSKPPTCVHALGVIKKQSGAIRPITDCKRPIGESVNCHMNSTFSTFSYVSCDDAIHLMSPGCYMCCVDLQSAYRSVNIHPDDKKYCGLQLDFGEGPVWLTDNCFFRATFSAFYFLQTHRLRHKEYA